MSGRTVRVVMLVAGALTGTMVYAAVAPQAALEAMFGEGLSGPLAEVLVRNWGALVGLVGAALVYGAFVEPARPLALALAALSKLAFIGLALAFGARYLGQPLGWTLAVDGALVVALLACLVAVRGARAGG